MWIECRFLDTEVDGTNPGISMSCPLARDFIRIDSNCICIVLKISSLLSKNHPGFQCACMKDNLFTTQM